MDKMTDKERLVELLHFNGCDYNCEICEYSNSDDSCIDYLEKCVADHLIANGVVVQKQGEWLPYPSDMYMKCSVCGMEYPKSQMPLNVGYCPNPNCGAKMD